ncbi:hypothetical protein ATANTOWER_018601 [Ataeniobius toweri]|uniref:Uncharacterized protein n=1 Tax=Ataeniobius toweri TaxID=208326 RepID=A0ABU7AS82_9TELE|nr:hypothetical protein [Ataeniobius toweri]
MYKQDAVEDFKKDDNCKARQAEVSPGQYQPTDKGQRKKGETKLKTTLGEDSEMNDDSRELHKEGQEKEGGMEISVIVGLIIFQIKCQTVKKDSYSNIYASLL